MALVVALLLFGAVPCSALCMRHTFVIMVPARLIRVDVPSSMAVLTIDQSNALRMEAVWGMSGRVRLPTPARMGHSFAWTEAGALQIVAAIPRNLDVLHPRPMVASLLVTSDVMTVSASLTITAPASRPK